MQFQFLGLYADLGENTGLLGSQNKLLLMDSSRASYFSTSNSHKCHYVEKDLKVKHTSAAEIF
jgi:hypothetical protein